MILPPFGAELVQTDVGDVDDRAGLDRVRLELLRVEFQRVEMGSRVMMNFDV